MLALAIAVRFDVLEDCSGLVNLEGIIAYNTEKQGAMMTQIKTRKASVNFRPEQKLEYAKLMVVEGYSTKQIMEISGAGATAAARWKKQYQRELRGQTPEGKKAFTPDQQRIQELEK